LDTLYTYAWFVTFALGFGIYYVLMKASKGDPINATDR
jgi:cytosine/uracil/thiamine/allantoin permease